MSTNGKYLVEMRNVSKTFGHIQALLDVDLRVRPGEVVGLLGDNGAGKSTLIKILQGYHQPTGGEIYFEGHRVDFNSPADARGLGIETVPQDLGLVDLMSIARNFFLGREPKRQVGPFRLLDHRAMNRISTEALKRIGIAIRDPLEPVGTLSGGERQSIAIGRAEHFGAKLVILDEPTSALSVRQTRRVLDYILEARSRGLSIIFITHNVYQAHRVSDRFVILRRGKRVAEMERHEVTVDELADVVMGVLEPEEIGGNGRSK